MKIKFPKIQNLKEVKKFFKLKKQYDENGKYIGEAAHEHGPNCNHDKVIKDIKVIKTKVADGKVKANCQCQPHQRAVNQEVFRSR